VGREQQDPACELEGRQAQGLDNPFEHGVVSLRRTSRGGKRDSLRWGGASKG
jgi:hypothetical protein